MGVTIRSGSIGIVGFDLVQTTTDAEGRYRLAGMPKAEGCSIRAIPKGDQPYGVDGKQVPVSPGLEAVTVNFELKRGIWIEGKITDKVTGKPLQAGVVYSPLESNPNLATFPNSKPGFPGMNGPAAEKKSNPYRVLGIPGPGLIAVDAPTDHYFRASEREDEFGTKGLKEPLVGGGPPASDQPMSRFCAALG